jgi:hypothetical protein
MAEFALQVVRLFLPAEVRRPSPQFTIEPKITAAICSKSAANFLLQVVAPVTPRRASSSKP